MSVFRSRAGTVLRIAILGIFAVVGLSCGERPEAVSPISDEERETWDATAFFLAGVFTASQNPESDASLVENFRANYVWLRDVFIPHLEGKPEHDWTSCPEYCIPAAEKLANGDRAKEEHIKSKLSGGASH